MFLRITVEIVLAIALLYPAFMFWQLRKRKRFWKQAVRNRAFLKGLIFSRESLANPPSDLLAYVRTPPKQGGYMWNMKVLFDADKLAIRRFSIRYGTVIVAIVVASAFVGPTFLAISIVLFFLAAIVPISPAARSDASENIFTIGLILHKWRLENAADCDQFIEQAHGLLPVYEAVKHADAYDAFRTGKQIWNDVTLTGGSPEFRETKKKEALRYFDQAIANGYDTSEVFSLRGSCLKDLGFYFDALEDYNKAIQKQPNRAIANNYFMRSIIKDSLFDFEGSVADLKEAIRLSKLDNRASRPAPLDHILH